MESPRLGARLAMHGAARATPTPERRGLFGRRPRSSKKRKVLFQPRSSRALLLAFSSSLFLLLAPHSF